MKLAELLQRGTAAIGAYTAAQNAVDTTGADLAQRANAISAEAQRRKAAGVHVNVNVNAGTLEVRAVAVLNEIVTHERQRLAQAVAREYELCQVLRDTLVALVAAERSIADRAEADAGAEAEAAAQAAAAEAAAEAERANRRPKPYLGRFGG